ncbi:MAG: MATE family efflux transporter [Verrucomicrobia bacterium]|nr:MATE family efflux transporter [Verrucomicrobiota bacterium]
MTNSPLDLTADSIPRLVRSMAVPAALGFFFQTMYNVVDTYFAGKISTDALASLSIGFPVFFMIIALASGTSTGATAVMAKALGARDHETAKIYVAQVVTFGLLVSGFLTLLGPIASPHLFRILGAEGTYLDIATGYMRIIFGGSTFFIFASVLNAPLYAVGDTKSFRNTLIIGFICNVILDPWFIFGGFGLPAMGFRGVAVSTILIQFFICIYLAIKVRHTGMMGKDFLRHLRPRAACMRELAINIVPATFNMFTVGLGIFVITWFISRFGQNGVAAYGVATRVEQIMLLPTIGLNTAALALAGQNFGAGRMDRVRETTFTGLKYGFYLMMPAGIILFFVAHPFMAFFTDDTEVIRIGVQYLRIAAFALFPYVILFVSVSTLQGMRRPMFAVWIGLWRQLIAPLLLLPILSQGMGMGLAGVWWGIFVIVWSSALFTLWYANRTIRHTPTTIDSSVTRRQHQC